MSDRPVCRLYLATPAAIPDLPAFAGALEAALDGGDVACLLLRQTGSDEALIAAAHAVFPRAQARGVACLLDGRPDLIESTGADGAHLRADEGNSVRAARRGVAGGDAILGAACGLSRHDAMEEAEAGADYVAFGDWHGAATKPPSSEALAELLSWWQEVMEVPCVAIADVEPGAAAAMASAGADFVAVCDGVWGHPEGPGAATAAYAEAFARCAV